MSEAQHPHAFICPITQEVMKSPVILIETGQSYEKAAIEKWLVDHDTDPLSNKRLTNKIIIPNIALRNAIQESGNTVNSEGDNQDMSLLGSVAAASLLPISSVNNTPSNQSNQSSEPNQNDQNDQYFLTTTSFNSENEYSAHSHNTYCLGCRELQCRLSIGPNNGIFYVPTTRRNESFRVPEPRVLEQVEERAIISSESVRSQSEPVRSQAQNTSEPCKHDCTKCSWHKSLAQGNNYKCYCSACHKTFVKKFVKGRQAINTLELCAVNCQLCNKHRQEYCFCHVCHNRKEGDTSQNKCTIS